MKLVLLALSVAFLGLTPARANRGEACARTRPCAEAVAGRDQRLCRAYVEKAGCAALSGEDQGWCAVLTEGRSCYEALLGSAQEACEEDQFPGTHLYWKACGTRPRE